MIQGDIGVRVMDVGALYYTSSISGPVIVSATSEFNDLFNFSEINLLMIFISQVMNSWP